MTFERAVEPGPWSDEPNEPAYPTHPSIFSPNGDISIGGDGMTLRDYFAAKAMVGITQALAQGIRPHDVPKLAADAYFIADAMLEARKA